ncbi:MAG: Metal dependent phosphohydrolase [Candidatus Nomurabacteria bacterium GW2011_GWA2_43_15]|uniref:Metal dependent phosphohydrolase n=2 Tax=Candidatus Nomuraibacteriota TaxID=1752729 RepID=A0A0G1DTN9_9BACT|nr:MAG: Metal dependent phosphohydrolase [Candidatus Nomurabacteria bacterium GW2011_GWA2_43_15]KKT19276.1 MAG: Metal dependent phosphohydrolase [Candidatus Nomurabacteria bacterium GW2011_GWB1_43_7]
MPLPTKVEARTLLKEHVKDEYQRYHAGMVASALEGYAKVFGADEDLWYVTGLLHDIDFEEYPDLHPAESLKWFAKWGYPEELIHAVEAHAYGYHGFTTLPDTKLSSALMACDEISGIFYAYRKLNPVPYGEMKVSSIKKRLAEKGFASGIDRESIKRGCEALGIALDEHIANLIKFLAESR